jgi:hypothetical protein
MPSIVPDELAARFAVVAMTNDRPSADFVTAYPAGTTAPVGERYAEYRILYDCAGAAISV